MAPGIASTAAHCCLCRVVSVLLVLQPLLCETLRGSAISFHFLSPQGALHSRQERAQKGGCTEGKCREVSCPPHSPVTTQPL